MRYFNYYPTLPAHVFQRASLQHHWNRQAVLARRSSLSAALQAGKRSYRQELSDAFRDAIEAQFGPGCAQ